MRQSLGCLTPEPGWECFYTTNNAITDNETWGNVPDLYHYEESLGNIWDRNTCETKEGTEIPECILPSATLIINYNNGKPGSFFTVEGANYPVNDMATITINGITLGTVPTDPSGNLLFLLNTVEADEGEYIVTADVNPSSSVRFVLDSSKRTRPQERQGTIFVVPKGITTHFVYIPLILR